MPPIRWADIALKALLAVGFFFVLQYVVLKATMEVSLLWSAGMGCVAACLAYSQQRR